MENAKMYIGMCLCDLNKVDEPHLHLPYNFLDYLNSYKAYFEDGDKGMIEIQAESPYVFETDGNFLSNITKNKWLWIPYYETLFDANLRDHFKEIYDQIRKSDIILGIHQPIRDINILSDDSYWHERSVRSIEESMRFANDMNAIYFIIHMVQYDNWNMPRQQQFETSIDVLKRLSTFYHKNSFSFVPCIENLEFPKLPATGFEISFCYDTIRKFWPKIKICFDLPHLWNSQRIIKNHAHTPQPFHMISGFDNFSEICSRDYTAYLYSLKEFECIPGEIFLYHIGGCYDNMTHGIPGLKPWENPFDNAMNIDCPSRCYDLSREMDVSKTLDIIVSWSDSCIRMILEADQKPNAEAQRAISDIRKTLKAKTKRLERKLNA
ncbi:MAG: hypothetical protein HZB65_04460 [Candidatus Aenigmarchaeota archaeon]|nr:hypothetical protein [Candidatus Aenigmarchaeota archaeon]